MTQAMLAMAAILVALVSGAVGFVLGQYLESRRHEKGEPGLK